MTSTALTVSSKPVELADRMTFPVVVDACALIPYHLSDLLLRLSDAGLFEIQWSKDILAEVERNLPKLGVDQKKAARRVAQMQRAFPLAAIEGYKGLIPAMTNDPKDRHVLAAAVRSGATVIVTVNLKDFPPASLAPYGIEVVHPDEFLLSQLDLDEEAVIDCLGEQREAYKRPALSFNEFYRSLKKVVPRFVADASVLEAARFPTDAPLPLEIVDGDAAMDAFFPDGPPTPLKPLGAAFLWWRASRKVAEYLNALRNLSVNPQDWGDYRQAAGMLDGWSIMQFVEYNADAPDRIAYVKFMVDTGHAMRSFGVAPLETSMVLTMLRGDDGIWRVWSLGDLYFPTADEVLGH